MQVFAIEIPSLLLENLYGFLSSKKKLFEK